MHNLPISIRAKDKIINSLLYRYKEEDLLVQPDLQDIYAEIDMVLKKIAVKVVPDYLDNEQQNRQGITSEGSEVKERILTKDVLLWKNLDAEEVFEPELYNDDEVNKVKIEQKELAELSPSATLELSLNKMPFNLYRHADLDNFSVFTKYRKKIYQDYLTDKVIDPEIEFKFFSLDQAQTRLQKIKKPEEIPDRFYGYAKRKSGEAEVFVVKGTGKVTINGEPLADYCGDVYHRGEVLKPLIFTETAGKYDLEFNVVGGGIHSQAECMAMALTKALIMINPKFEKPLASVGLVGTDDRIKEPKRIGLYSARVRPPYVRR
jgi:small subunit ribosomal protein S9